MSAHPQPCFIIPVSGCDASGKGTVSTTLQAKFAELYPEYEMMHFREPGGNELGEACRTVIAQQSETGGDLLPCQELVMFFAGRIALWRQFIHAVKSRPPGSKPVVILLDRSFACTWAYQVVGMEGSTLIRQMFFALTQELMEFLHKQLPQAQVHHLLIDISPKEAEHRNKERGPVVGGITKFDEPETQRRVVQGYGSFPSQIRNGDTHPAGMIHVAHRIDGMGDKPTVFGLVKARLDSILTPAA